MYKISRDESRRVMNHREALNPFLQSTAGLYVYEPCPMERGLNAFAKSIDSGQPAQSAQADLSRNFSQ